ncbi:MAG: glycosyltransferase family 2 protein [Elusimicrobiota bacterium]
MRISVIIPTVNFAPGLVRMMADLRRQTAELAEIIVIDSSSDDGTAELARGLGARVLVVPRKDFDHGGTRALAAREAGGEILVYLTQDAVLAGTQAIARLAAPFAGGDKIGCAFGRQLPHPGADIFGRALRYFNYPAAPHVRRLRDRARYGIKTAFISDSFSAYSREALREAGWFKDGLIMGEDTCAGARLLIAGYGIAYVAGAEVFHSHNYTAWQEFKRYFDIGVLHRDEHWLLETFGGAEGEGVKFMLAGLRFLGANGAALRAPEFILRTGLKYLGYKAGFFHGALPRAAVKRLSMNGSWWDR